MSVIASAGCTPAPDAKSTPDSEPASAASGPAGAPTIPRSVRVNTGTITLGERLAPSVATTRASDTIAVLGRSAIPGAERVYIRLTPAGIVRAVIVDYVQANFFSMLDEHAVTLGAPERSNPTRRGEEPTELATWRDPRTELRLLRDPNRSAWTVRTELIDRAGSIAR